MSQWVDVNIASQNQLSVLLGLSELETQVVIQARPFANAEDFQRVLPPRVASTRPNLYLQKLDINQATEKELTQVVGLEEATAKAILENRPYYFMAELFHLPEVNTTVAAQIASFFTTPDFTYQDKLTKQMLKLKPSSSELLISFNEVESTTIDHITDSLGLQVREPFKNDYGLFSVTDRESATQVLAQLKEEPGVLKAIPVFETSMGEQRYFDPEFLAVQFIEDASTEAAENLITELGCEISEQFQISTLFIIGLPNGKAATSKLQQVLAQFNSSPIVKFAEPLYIGFNDLETQDSLASHPTPNIINLRWNFDLIHLPKAWAYGVGSPDVIIAVIDTGVDETHPALQGGVLPRGLNEDWNFADKLNLVPLDKNGHGTFIAGLLVGNGALEVQGICPGCRLLPIKIPLTSGTADYAYRRDAILYALNKVQPNQRLVLNLSWKTTGDIGLIRDAIETAVAQGAIVIASAGNWPTQDNEPHYPSDYPDVISVASVGRDGQRAPYSFYGNQVDLAAPGGSGTNSTSDNIFSAALGSATRYDFGTSFAAPHAVGVAALLWSQNLQFSAAQIRNYLELAAVPLAESGLGQGLIHAGNALTKLQQDLQAQPHPNPNEIPPQHSILAALNQDDWQTLVAKFGFAKLTARLLVIHRPFSEIQQIRGTLGLTEEQYLQLLKQDQQTQPHTELSEVSLQHIALAALNQDDWQTLVAKFGFAKLTARLLVIHRPFSEIQQIRGTLGLTEEQYLRLIS
jgi:subtilisin family serine protease